jgi:hypothetical protein
MERSERMAKRGADSGMAVGESVAGTALAEYNPRFAENPYGRIFPAHFFCLIAFVSHIHRA